jgi:hypothetical protein
MTCAAVFLRALTVTWPLAAKCHEFVQALALSILVPVTVELPRGKSEAVGELPAP